MISASTKDRIIKKILFVKKVTIKLNQQIEDFICMACQAMPEWCYSIATKCPFLLSFETRHKYFTCTAFGITRSIVWLQSRAESFFEGVPGGLAAVTAATGLGRRDDGSADFIQLGRLRHERVTVPRDQGSFLPWAKTIITLHANRKSVLEVEFDGEEGTGLGPTLEFYSLTAAELQRKSLKMWIVEDQGLMEEHHGYYVHQMSGLFPAPWPQDHEEVEEINSLFSFLGSLIAKCLQVNLSDLSSDLSSDLLFNLYLPG